MTTNRDIKYLNKDFDSFRSQLIEFSKTYFPTTYTDFTPASPGMMFIEQGAYVGDVLSFYLDNQIQENFLTQVRQTNNVYEQAYINGYKPKVTGLAVVDVDIYQIIPSKTSGTQTVPDYDYCLYIDPNTRVSTNNGTNFFIEDPVDFSISTSVDPTEVTIYSVAAGQPTYYLLKKTRKAVSGDINTTSFSFGAYKEFPTVEINVPNISHIIDIVDSDGNVWYEVDFLAQELVFDDIKNSNYNDPNNFVLGFDTPYILKTKQVQRRFITRFIDESQLRIQFGAGNSSNVDEEVIPNPDNVGLGLPFEKSKLTTAFSPTNFIFTNTYGIAPSNTTLTVRYLTGGGVEANISSNSLTNLDINQVSFIKSDLNSATAQFIFNSLEVNNLNAASGGKDGDSIEEIRQNSLSNFSTQLRNVTPNDYLIRTLSMPSKYGAISKSLVRKPNIREGNGVLDIYTLGYDVNKKLTNTSVVLKNNLKTYLNQYKMVDDTINIKDGFVINIGCKFELITLPNVNNNDVLSKSIIALQDYFSIDKWQINQPIILREISILLDKIEGVQTVKSVKIENKRGTNSGYSKYSYDIDGAIQNGVVYPSLDPSIFEVKYPNQDIKGQIVNI